MKIIQKRIYLIEVINMSKLYPSDWPVIGTSILSLLLES